MNVAIILYKNYNEITLFTIYAAVSKTVAVCLRSVSRGEISGFTLRTAGTKRELLDFVNEGS